MHHKNDYSCIVFFEDGSQPKKREYVHKLNSFASFLNNKHRGWKYFNVYERRSNKFLKQFRKGVFVPPFLALIFVLVTFFFLTFNS